MKTFKKILIANRSEIAIRVMRAANELELKTVAIYAEEDKLSLHRFKADEAYRVGAGKGPIEAYLDIPDIIRIAKQCGADAIHPGYGFLSERPDFADACAEAGITFIGPPANVMRSLGDKVSARNIAEAASVPVTPATVELPEDMDEIRKMAAMVGYPLMLKASWGGGGRGMRVIESENELEDQVRAGRSEALSAFGRGEVYLEKLIRKARHVEVQILGDSHGNVVHLFERDCSVQRRHQKIVERAPAPYLTDATRKEVCDAALKLMNSVSYEAAGTVEFLMDSETDAFYFIEVNPRVQVEHTVTEEITGVDIVKAQIRIAQGGKIGVLSGPQMSGVPEQKDIQMRGCALQARVTTEDPEIGFVPDYGRITAYRGAMGFGIRLDGGTAYSGAVITRHYDSLLEKVTAWAPTEDEVIRRLDRALREFRIRGVATNITFLENLINHPTFKSAEYTTRFIDETPELFKFPKRRDRATKLLNYIADVTVNGHPQTKDRPRPAKFTAPPAFVRFEGAPKDGTKQRLDKDGPDAFAKWMVDQKQVLITDTTMRDAHQSLLATRFRSYDIVNAAEAYAHMFPQLLSLECWGGATFDVAMRFLQECPWKRLRAIREKAPNILLQMLLRGSNGVGYKNYPDNTVQHFIHQAASEGVDLFRVFDSLNWVENMRVAMDAVRKEDKLCEAAICYTGDILNPDRTTYDLDYYLKMGQELKAAGAHILAVKDMAGLLKPAAARLLIAGLKKETGLPVHFHTHDTSGIASATVLAAIEAGVDAVDLAMDALSGLTSQPNLGSVVSALNGGDRDPGLDHDHIRTMSGYWAGVREQYAAFEANLRTGASEVYVHEMPGGQFTNLKEQARSLGLAHRWDEIANTYADVNMMFGDIPKVTPSSKVVGDMALAMISAGLTRAQVEDPNHDVSFPDSVISFFKGELGQPPNGFPKALQAKVLKGEKPLKVRPGLSFPPADLVAERAAIEKTLGAKIPEDEFASYLMYPKVYTAFAHARAKYGPVDILPTPAFFYGMAPGDEAMVDLEPGKTLNIRLSAIGDTDDTGEAKVFFELNGQPRAARAPDRSATAAREKLPQAEAGNAAHVGAPMRGMIATVAVEAGAKVEEGDLLLTLEAMKMETSIHADRAGTLKKIYVKPGDNVDAKDMLVEFEG